MFSGTEKQGEVNCVGLTVFSYVPTKSVVGSKLNFYSNCMLTSKTGEHLLKNLLDLLFDPKLTRNGKHVQRRLLDLVFFQLTDNSNSRVGGGGGGGG
jgi:hypothetical protein